MVVVDRDTCDCACWDGAFKGGYDRGGYKSIYFNMDVETFVIMGIFLFYSSLAFKALSQTVRLLLARKLRISACLVLVTCVYPNFYAFWMFFNYINDRFYQLWYSQLAFSATELVVAYSVYHMLDRSADVSRRNLWACAVISAWHIAESLIDQGFQNLILGQGQMHQVLRDLFFLFGDFTVLGFVLLQLYRSYISTQVSIPLAFDTKPSPRALLYRHLLLALGGVLCSLVAFRAYLRLVGEHLR